MRTSPTSVRTDFDVVPFRLFPLPRLTGPQGLLTALTRKVLSAALEVEMADHLGYDRHDPVGLDPVGAGLIDQFLSQRRHVRRADRSLDRLLSRRRRIVQVPLMNS